MLFCCVFFLFFAFFCFAKELVKKTKSFFKYINQSACIEIDGAEDLGLLYKKSGNIRGCSIARKYRFGPFLFCEFQCFFFFLFLIFNKRWCYVFIIPITDSKHLQESYFVIVQSQTAIN